MLLLRSHIFLLVVLEFSYIFLRFRHIWLTYLQYIIFSIFSLSYRIFFSILLLSLKISTFIWKPFSIFRTKGSWRRKKLILVYLCYVLSCKWAQTTILSISLTKQNAYIVRKVGENVCIIMLAHPLSAAEIATICRYRAASLLVNFPHMFLMCYFSCSLFCSGSGGGAGGWWFVFLHKCCLLLRLR